MAVALFAPLSQLAAQAGATTAAPTATGTPVLRIGRASAPLRIDGRLDEPAWATADSIGGLTQIEPVEGEAPRFRTVVRVLAEPGGLVIGIRADDEDAKRITAFARSRDAELSSEDHLRIILDTYRDGRSAFVFAVNPNGARYDALVVNQGEGENANWDALWESATTRSPTGWTAEIRLPARSLLYRRGLDSWGFNVQRRVQRLLETSRWASPARDIKFGHASRAGVLADVPAFDVGMGLSVRPAIAGGGGHEAAGTEWSSNGELSLDATQRIGANARASLTINTDFAETEVDTRRTNLTRFPLVFPEKRTFFLEGSDIFDFGLGTGDDVRPFFSRRIGLIGGDRVPISAGLKLNGRQGGTSFGALGVRTGRADGALAAVPTANTLTAVRVRQNVLRESTVGFLATAGDPTGRQGAWTAGPDVTYQTSHFAGNKNFLAGAWALGTGRDSLRGRTGAYGAKIDYPNDLWDVSLAYKWIGDAFEPALGFVPRPGVQSTSLEVNYLPRPRRRVFGLRVRQMVNEFRTSVVHDLAGRWESYRVFMAPVNWRLESGDRFEYNVVPVGERLIVPFTIAEGVTIPTGTYEWKRYRLEAGLAAKRRFSGQFTWWFGQFYTGRLDELIATASFKPSAMVIVEFNATRNVGRLPEGNFVQQVVGARLRVNVSPDLQVNSYVQYDQQSRSIGVNSRLRWTFTPLGDLFVVYNHNLDEGGDRLSPHRRWGFASNQLLLKCQYAFRY